MIHSSTDKHNTRKWIIGVLVVLFIVGLVIGLNLAKRVKYYKDSSTTGNTSGNLLNGGLFAQSGNTIYFANPYDQNMLYSMRDDLTHVKRLSKDNVSYINAAGSYLFYTRRNDKKKIDSDALLNLSNTGLYRTNTKGGQIGTLYRGATQALCLYGNNIYYQHYDQEKGLLLYSVKIDGSEDTQLLAQAAAVYSVENDTLYYTGMDKDHNIYAMNTDGSGSHVIYEGNCTSLSLTDGWLYFLDMAQDYCLCRMRTDGTELTRLTNERLATYNTDGETLYYQVDNGEDNGLYAMNVETGASHLLRTGNYNFIHILNNHIFFEDFKGSALYEMDPDTEEINEFQP